MRELRIAGMERYPNGLVVWGLRHKPDTFRFIMSHFYYTARRLGYAAVWTDDSPRDASAVKPGTLVIACGVASKHLPRVAGADYCLHNLTEIEVNSFDPMRSIVLQVYTNDAEHASERWDAATLFDSHTRTLYQAWGTNRLPNDFLAPVAGRWPVAVFIGSVWDNEFHQGNLPAIAEYRNSLAVHGVRFVHFRAPDRVAVAAVRASRISAAISGPWQVEVNYLPCRMFKNISYGQLGVSNVRKFAEVLSGATVAGDTIAELVDTALALSPTDRRELTAAQQDHVRQHTYVTKLGNITRALSLGGPKA